MNPLVGFSELWGPTSLAFTLLSPHTPNFRVNGTHTMNEVFNFHLAEFSITFIILTTFIGKTKTKLLSTLGKLCFDRIQINFFAK